jgi:hypothetical protein
MSKKIKNDEQHAVAREFLKSLLFKQSEFFKTEPSLYESITHQIEETVKSILDYEKRIR